MLAARLVLGAAVLLTMLVPAWWLAGRLDEKATPFFRLLLAAALSGVAYLTVVNLAGRLLHQSLIPATLYVVSCIAAAAWLLLRRSAETSLATLRDSRRDWLPIVAIALVLATPQLVLAVSTPYWDEMASSAIHITGANQFAEGVFPPRHNALPDIVAKYHYAFIILSGTVHWLTGLSANVSIDVVSTGLWLFTFLFVVHWLLSLGIPTATSLWGATATLLGGGLAWVFMRRIETYNGFEVSPPPSELVYSYDGSRGFMGNLVGDAAAPSAHLRNADGTLSNLPWDIAAQFQQHAVSLGIALTVFALYVFVTWRRRAGPRTLLTAVTIATFGLLFLAHAVFGGVAAVTGGLVLLFAWLRGRTRQEFLDGVVFGVGVAVVALLHGGFLAIGREYGGSTDVLTLRDHFGYSRGGVPGFIAWNIAGFGIPLVLSLVALATRTRAREVESDAARETFLVIAVFAVFSYLIPQLAFYSSETIGVEQFTEISKFFFTAHLGFALLSVWGASQLPQLRRPLVLIPAAAAMAITPLSFAWVHSTSGTGAHRQWLGRYFSPYFRNSVEQQMGEHLRRLKHSSRDTYFDASADERAHGYLGELLVFGGSVFTLTPSRYERTGIGYRLATDTVAARMVQNGRMAQLRPGAAESCNCRWYYARPQRDLAFAPPFIRARFAKLVAESAFVARFAAADRVLFEITRPTTDVDRDIERYWRPRVVMQAMSDWNGDGRGDLVFYDYVGNRVIVGDTTFAGPLQMEGELGQLWVGRFTATNRASLVQARAKDTRFSLGRRIEELVEENMWGWSFRPAGGGWSPEYERWSWTGDIPLVVRTDRAAPEASVIYRPASGEWFDVANRKLSGPSLPATELPVPFTGHFLRGSGTELGVRSRTTGTFVVQSMATGQRVEFKWGLGPNEVLVPADYDGDGYDEFAIWNESNQFWYWRSTPDGPITQFRFGVPGAVPLPFDYNHDGRVDAAFWVAADRKIYVTLSRGARVDMTIAVPPHAIPSFVNVF